MVKFERKKLIMVDGDTSMKKKILNVDFNLFLS